MAAGDLGGGVQGHRAIRAGFSDPAERKLSPGEYDLRGRDPPGGCTATGVRGGGTFTVVSLNWLVASDNVADQMGHVEDILLRYDPGETSETTTISCPGGATIAEDVFVARWNTFFFGTHAEEIWMGDRECC